MRITKEELKILAKQVQLEFSDEELEQVSSSIYSITGKLEEIMKLDTENVEPTIINTDQNYNKEGLFFEDDESMSVDMTKINNYDGKYVVINKEENE